jgi:hypothetical protein
LVTVSFTEYLPTVIYVCDGFCNVEVFPTLISLNIQPHIVGFRVDRSENVT